MTKLMSHLNLELPEYSRKLDPTKNDLSTAIIDWSICTEDIDHIKNLYEKNCRGKKRKSEKTVQNVKKKEEIKDEVKVE